MTPLHAYYQKIQEKILQPDPGQEIAMQHLQAIYVALLSEKKWSRLTKKKITKGLYLWGEVGRGKTQLMDLFYEHLPIPKLRMHFYQFMHEIHQQLTRSQGQVNPLKRIAKDLARTTKVICLDELLVHEIADAMLLAQLLRALLQQGITLITTANIPPDSLYHNGLQRELFLPAIALLKKHLTILHLDSSVDYRLQHEQEYEKNNFFPLFTMTTQQLQQLFTKLCQGKVVSYQALVIHERLIPHKGYANHIIWFDFTSICAIPRSQLDYLSIAKRFSTVLISNLTPIAEHDDNRARLFIHLVDIFYDAGIRLILTSETQLADLYPKGRFSFEFKRVKSRLSTFKKTSLVFITNTFSDNTQCDS
jgi:cell division protein ZapE